ncbi:MAG: hypothetical protein KKB75_03955 [Alphaproteobacteria bacterium]|uniref:hypothetical protein n=1 Tax=Hyphomonas sp. TaxID=87 RepID=UPI001DF9A2C8|nr:hypothetical protein [Alphaproteobacteria bacterium]MBU2143106.1 hypothetical protein [Alphaproteobacteria bacterium]MBU2195818.1 hypothetical protein [Alphaproteobacteria bacterium]
MDTTKLRLFAAVAGIVFGLGGVFALAVALTLALAIYLGTVGATFTVAALFLSAACICLFLFLQPNRSSADELDDIEDATADALADLPFDALKSIVEKRPLTVAALALVAGYSVVKDPAAVARHAQRFMVGLI